MDEQRQEPEGVGPHVVLIHGTWAREASWDGPEGKMQRVIRSQLPGATCEEHPWSGANSPRARADAATSLKERVRRLTEEGRQVFLVAHSHGGNAALTAANAFDTSSEMIGVKGVACLATPFIDARPRAVPESSRRIGSTIASSFLWAPFLLYCSVKSAEFVLPESAGVEAAAEHWQSEAILILMVLLCVRVVLQVLIARLLAYFRVRAPLWAERLNGPVQVSAPVLIVHTKGSRGQTIDEALLALGASRALTDWAFGVWKWATSKQGGRTGCLLALALFLLGILLSGVAQADALSIVPPTQDLFVAGLLLGLVLIAFFVAVLAVVALAVFIGLCLSIVAVAGILGLFCGSYILRPLAWGMRGEAWLAPLVVRVTARERPHFDAHVVSLERDGSLRGRLRSRSLFHSLHSDTEAVEIVAEWIGQQSRCGI